MPITWAVSSAGILYRKSVKEFYDQSERKFREKGKASKLYYSVRTVLVRNVDREDLDGKILKSKLNALLDAKLHNLGLKNYQYKYFRIEKAMGMPDLVNSTQLFREKKALAERFAHRDKFTKSCWFNCFHCLVPKVYWDQDCYNNRINSINSELEKLQGNWTEVEESSFGFGFTNSLTAGKLLRYETSKYYNKNLELKFLPKLELNMFKSQKSDLDMSIKKPTGSLNEPLMLASDSGVKSPKSNLSNNLPLELMQVCKITDEKSEFEIIANPLKGSKITPEDFDKDKDTHPFDMDDLLWGNLGNKLKEGCCKRFGFGLILCLMFFFLSTPTAILQAIKSQKF
jgi:hypothetical protein